ncbi:hypothetical protein GCM10009678_16010 [Actinomadura kijaniata]|uniref:Uncharacterized protein n=1 Tax=Actinomadura namibiensis TaxID=182080 RepID=A0A7W3LIV9_ACTNM|nr:hypothetical protein [Actinomadura namibiensis]MBA8948920.1 hypothetical protein [Actinomadura namibiensis]
MLNDALVAAVSFLAGCGVTALWLGRRRGSPATGAPGELPAPLQESITAFGEELRGLTVTPEETEANPRVLEDYRLALSAYDRAAAAGSERAALAALRDGRAALIRLAARRAGRPVPIDALPPLDAGRDAPEPPAVPENATGERFLIVGGGEGAVEELIDRPEPDRPAIVEVTSTNGGRLAVTPVVRTEDETETGVDLLRSYRESSQDRVLLWPGPTHLRVESSSEEQRWSVRIRPMSAAPSLGAEWRGRGGREVLFYDGGPALLTAQARSRGFWRIWFMCGCLQDRDCRCRGPRWPAGTPGESGRVWSSEDGQRKLRLPRPGYLVLDGDEDDHEWYLSVEPVPEAPPPPRKASRPRRRPSSNPS